MFRYSAIEKQPVENFQLPEGSVIEGYYVSPWDGLRYPYGKCADGFWAADADGWGQWPTEEQRAAAWQRACESSMQWVPAHLASTVEIQAAQDKAMTIMGNARRFLEETGLEASLIARCPNGARWPVLMLEAGQTFSDIEAVRNGHR